MRTCFFKRGHRDECLSDDEDVGVGGVVAIVTAPGVHPTRVGSAWVEDQAGSRGV